MDVSALTHPEVGTWSIEDPYDEWLIVPSDGEEGFDQWYEDCVELFISKLSDGVPAELIVEKTVISTEAKLVVDQLRDFSRELSSPSHHLVAFLGLAKYWPIPVIIEVAEPIDDDPSYLLNLATSGLGSPIQDVEIEYLGDAFGDTVCVNRFDLDKSGALLASVVYASRRSVGVDVVMTWRTFDFGLIPRFKGPLYRLLDHIRLETAG